MWVLQPEPVPSCVSLGERAKAGEQTAVKDQSRASTWVGRGRAQDAGSGWVRVDGCGGGGRS